MTPPGPRPHPSIGGPRPSSLRRRTDRSTGGDDDDGVFSPPTPSASIMDSGDDAVRSTCASHSKMRRPPPYVRAVVYALEGFDRRKSFDVIDVTDTPVSVETTFFIVAPHVSSRPTLRKGDYC